MKAVICGAGISGLTLAQRLATLGWEVMVLEKAPGPRTQGYMIDFFGAGYDAAEAMGMLPRLHELGYHVDEARFVDEDGRRRGRIGFAQFARTMEGRMVSIMRPDLELALRENLPDVVDLRFSTTLTYIENRPGEVLVTLTDGTVVHADVLVGADGIHSTVRRLVFGEEQDFLRHLGFNTAAFTFTDPAIHAQVGDCFHLTDSIDRQVGLYALRGGRVAAFLVHRTEDPTLPADPRATLLAEYACYAVSLLAGQGASLGISGAYVLADQLHRAVSVQDGLDGYERLWRPVAEEKQLAGRKAARWFLPASPAELWMRRVMLAVSRLPGMDRVLAARIGGKHTAMIRELSRSGGVVETPRHSRVRSRRGDETG